MGGVGGRKGKWEPETSIENTARNIREPFKIDRVLILDF